MDGKGLEVDRTAVMFLLCYVNLSMLEHILFCYVNEISMLTRSRKYNGVIPSSVIGKSCLEI